MVAFLNSCCETFVHTNCSVRSNGERSQAVVVSLSIERKKSKRVLEMRQELQVDSRWALHCPSLSSYVTSSRYVKLLACQIFWVAWMHWTNHWNKLNHSVPHCKVNAITIKTGKWISRLALYELDTSESSDNSIVSSCEELPVHLLDEGHLKALNINIRTYFPDTDPHMQGGKMPFIFVIIIIKWRRHCYWYEIWKQLEERLSRKISCWYWNTQAHQTKL